MAKGEISQLKIKMPIRKNIIYSAIKVFIFKPFNSFFYDIKYYIIQKFCKNSIVISACLPYNICRPHILKNINWGDDVALILARLISNKRIIPLEFATNKKVNYACIGSIIQFPWIVQSNTIVWGSGIISPSLGLSNFPEKILAVRGPLSRDFLLKNGVDCPEIYGDPALLFPLYYKSNVKKKYKIGFIPHHLDRNDKNVMAAISQFSLTNDVIFIDIVNYGKWNKFIDKVNECDFIISSSLHGIIIADAYNIPNCWCEFSYKHPDSGFKFYDYFKSVKREVKESYKIKGTESFEFLISLKDQWTPPIIDLEPLIKCCPF